MFSFSSSFSGLFAETVTGTGKVFYREFPHLQQPSVLPEPVSSSRTPPHSRSYDRTGGRICGVDVYDPDLSAVEDYHREKCTVDFHGQDSRLQQPGGQPVVYRIDIDHGGTVPVVEPSGGILGDGISVPGSDVGEHQWMDYILYRVSGLC